MRMLHAWVSGLLLVMGLVSGPARAATPSSTATWLQTSLLSASTIQARMLKCLAGGDIAGAIAMYEAETGHVAPVWLRNLQVAYSVANQVAGKCQEVARIIHTAFTKLGQTPQYVAFKARKGEEYMVFELATGKDAPVSHTGYHVAVRLGDLIYDAYTGPFGMKLSDYLYRLHAREGVNWEVVSKP